MVAAVKEKRNRLVLVFLAAALAGPTWAAEAPGAAASPHSGERDAKGSGERPGGHGRTGPPGRRRGARLAGEGLPAAFAQPHRPLDAYEQPGRGLRPEAQPGHVLVPGVRRERPERRRAPEHRHHAGRDRLPPLHGRRALGTYRPGSPHGRGRLRHVRVGGRQRSPLGRRGVRDGRAGRGVRGAAPQVARDGRGARQARGRLRRAGHARPLGAPEGRGRARPDGRPRHRGRRTRAGREREPRVPARRRGRVLVGPGLAARPAPCRDAGRRLARDRRRAPRPRLGRRSSSRRASSRRR